MIKTSKIADYGMMLMGLIAAYQDRCLSALDLADETHVPLPTVSKVLTLLKRAGLLKSHRGVKGGYVLARPAREITVADIVVALDGPIALTQCIEEGPGACHLEPTCPSRLGWHQVNASIQRMLTDVTLADMAAPGPSPVAQQTERLLNAEGR
ncbi:MAG: SUF system Fe-S cluster assembly regulator [Alphaproteobacteria bacterium]|nr:SUF system Fe-S cluster assembly regulator [Alphaproteobacteria bacterium]